MQSFRLQFQNFRDIHHFNWEYVNIDIKYGYALLSSGFFIETTTEMTIQVTGNTWILFPRHGLSLPVLTAFVLTVCLKPHESRPALLFSPKISLDPGNLLSV